MLDRCVLESPRAAERLVVVDRDTWAGVNCNAAYRDHPVVHAKDAAEVAKSARTGTLTG